MNEAIHIGHLSSVSGTVQSLPSSKSLSNRALLINAMMGGKATLENLSTANDTQLMMELLHTPANVIHVEDAGTVMRFLTAYFAITGRECVITGTARMQQRPIGDLVDALRNLGARIDYGAREGFPPLILRGFTGQQATNLAIRGDISSQFISALMMVAPLLPHGLTINLSGKVSSRPYLDMTASMMQHFGVLPEMGSSTIRIPAGAYRPATYRVEPDWSAASYWFAFAALAKKAEIVLPGIAPEAIQGDRVIAAIMKNLGVKATFNKEGLLLTGGGPRVQQLEMNFTDCPDLAQTVLPVCAALGVVGRFTGMESLRVKETDRIAALQNELYKVGATLKQVDGTWTLEPGKPGDLPSELTINTYEDHRMAMGFAPYAVLTRVTIEDPQVVRKSYPRFWEDLEGMGFDLTR